MVAVLRALLGVVRAPEERVALLLALRARLRGLRAGLGRRRLARRRAAAGVDGAAPGPLALGPAPRRRVERGAVAPRPRGDAAAADVAQARVQRQRRAVPAQLEVRGVDVGDALEARVEGAAEGLERAPDDGSVAPALRGVDGHLEGLAALVAHVQTLRLGVDERSHGFFWRMRRRAPHEATIIALPQIFFPST